LTWKYKNNENYDPAEDELKKYAGFVYIITDKDNNKKYIGKKMFWSKKTLPPLKGKKQKRRLGVISDWKEYYGSSKNLQLLLEEKGRENFHREIIHLCETRGETGYMELYEQIKRNVLISDEYYNGIIQARIHRSHVKNLKDKFSD